MLNAVVFALFNVLSLVNLLGTILIGLVTLLHITSYIYIFET